MIAIARAVDQECKVLILDEPTSSLDDDEVEKLFDLMRRLRKDGVGIIFVTHFLEQVYAVCDRITVLRNGELVGEYETEKLPRLDLVAKMMGKDFNDLADIKSDHEIVIDDKKVYTYDDLVKYKENDNEIFEEKKNILLKYFNDLGLDYNNIILFLFNKYDSNMTIEPIKLRANKNEKLYKVSYKFKLI
jgi:ABC-type sugar transport system ATPase subunit